MGRLVCLLDRVEARKSRLRVLYALSFYVVLSGRDQSTPTSIYKGMIFFYSSLATRSLQLQRIYVSSPRP